MDFAKKIKKHDNTQFLVKTSNVNLNRKNGRKPVKPHKIAEDKSYIRRWGKKKAVKTVSKIYDKAVDTFYGTEQTADGYGEQTLADFGGKHKRLSGNIQNAFYYKNERKVLDGKKRKENMAVKAGRAGSAAKGSTLPKARRKGKRLADHSRIEKRKISKAASVKTRPVKRVILSARSKFAAVKIAVAAATSVVPIFIIILMAAIFASACRVCPIDAYSSKASQMYWDIGEWEADYKVKHKEKDEDGEVDTWYEWPYLISGGTTVDRSALLAYISAKYPFIENERSDGAEDALRAIYDDAIAEGLHEDIQGFIDLHKDELFNGTEYGDYKLYLQDEYILYRCYGSPTVGYEWQEHITSRLGARLDPISGKPGRHYGVDIACPVGTAVNSIMPATVSNIGEGGERGLYVTTVFTVNRGLLRQDIEIKTTYEHLSKVLVNEGQKVNTGDVIAISGNSGKSTGPHLHIEIKKNGNEPINPEIVCERN